MSDEKLKQLRASIEANPPRTYDLDNADDIIRLYHECWGYLRTCHHKHGTDWEGRQFAMDALKALINKTKLVRGLAARQRIR